MCVNEVWKTYMLLALGGGVGELSGVGLSGVGGLEDGEMCSAVKCGG